MKKAIGLFLLLVLTLWTTAALGSEAVNITSECRIKLSRNNSAANLTDGKYTTSWQHADNKTPYVALTAPAGSQIHGLYICFGIMPAGYDIQVYRGGNWVTVQEGDTSMYHVWIPLSAGADQVRIIGTGGKKQTMCINELFVFNAGEPPAWVQRWEPTAEKADILFLSAHPDDELIFFAGALPTYAVEQQRSVVMAYFSFSNRARRSELLNALWFMGIRQYPVIGDFRDSFQTKMSTAWRAMGGEDKVVQWVSALFRKYRPEVVVTHDINGEYGHTQHKIAALACQSAFDRAAEETYDPDTLEAYGAWKVKKLYLHLWPENQITLDWETPLNSMGGRTGLELAEEAYTTYHVTQRTSGMSVSVTGKKYDNHLFGLCRTRVGEDVLKNDFLENIYAPAVTPAPTPVPTPAPTPEPTPLPDWASVLPATNGKGFLPEGEEEYILADDTQGHYVYISQTLKVVITRTTARVDKSHELTWFDAEIWCDLEAGERLQNLFYDDELKGRAKIAARTNATEHKSVFAITTDYYIYRIGSKGSKHIGVEIRNGELMYDDRYTNPTTAFPNLDTLVLFPDGRMETYHSYEKSGQDYLDMGAETVYSFGPYLIKDGVVSSSALNSNATNNPRMAIGMVEPGHYVVILCEGRIKRSSGINLNHLAILMQERGCELAFNLDGGRTAVMCFMGQQLNTIFPNGGSTEARTTSEILAIGTSDRVGNVTFK